MGSEPRAVTVVGVDSGQIMVIDPCNIKALVDAGFDYDEMIKSKNPLDYLNALFPERGENQIVGYLTDFGGDGSYEVGITKYPHVDTKEED